MLYWHSCQICYPLEIKLLLLFASHNDKLTHMAFFIFSFILFIYFFFIIIIIIFFFLSFHWCFAILRHFSKYFGRGQLTYISTLFLGSLPGSISPLGAQSFVNNWQWPFLYQRTGENGRRPECHGTWVANPWRCILGRRGSDWATA